MLAAQNYINKKWVQSTGQPDNLNWTASTLDVYHDLIVVGNTQTTPGVSAVLVTKYDALGDELWQRTYSGTAGANNHGVAVVTNASGDVFVAATLSNSGTDLDLAVLKYDLGGTLAWVAQWNGPSNLADVPAALALDSAGNIFICGASFTDPIYADFALVKISPAGTVLWSKTYDHAGLLDAAVGVKIDPYGHPVVMGISAPNNLAWDLAALRYDGASGDGLDTIRVAQPTWGLQDAKAMHMDEAGNIYVTGSFHNGTDKNVQTLKLGAGFGMAWLVDHDEAGFDDEGLALAVDDSGYVYVCGAAGNGNGGTDFLTLKYAPEGELVWKRIFAPKGGPWPCKASKLAISGGQVVVTGTVNNNSKMNFATVVYEPDGTLGWSVLHHEGYGDDQALMLATKTFGVVYVSGISETPNGPVYTTVKYDVFHKENEAVTDTSGQPLYLDQEVMVKFRHHLLDTSIVDNKDWQHGTLAELVPDSVADAIESKLGLSQGMANRIKVVKVFRRWTRADSISLSRLGEEVRLPKYWSVFVLDGVSMDPKVASDSLSTLGEYVVYAHPNSIFEFHSNDPLYEDEYQGSLAPTAAFSEGHINIEPAWAIQSGQPFIRVGVLDTPISWGHEDLLNNGSSKVVAGYDYFSDYDIDDFSASTYAEYFVQFGLSDYHGTACAGIIGAIRNNGIGVAGIAGGDADGDANPGVSLVSLIIGGDDNYLTQEFIAPALVEGAASIVGPGVEHSFGCHVLNMSVGTRFIGPTTEPDQTLIDAVNTVYSNKCVLAAAMGNYSSGSGTYLNWPTAFPHAGFVEDHAIISVGGTGNDGTHLRPGNGTLNFFACYGNSIDLAAPGSHTLVSTLVGSSGSLIYCPMDYSTSPYSGYTCFRGTSAAAPHVAGVAALMLSEHNLINGAPNNLAPEDVEIILEQTTTEAIDPYDPWTDTGFDEYHGHGLLNAGAALQMVSDPYCVLHSGDPILPIGEETMSPQTITIPANNAWEIVPGQYTAYRVEVTHEYFDEFDPETDIINAWGRISSTIGTHASTQVDGRNWASYTFSLDANTAEVIAVTNCWFIENAVINGSPTSGFFPDIPSRLQTAYSLHLFGSDCWGPSTVAVQETPNAPIITVHPNPTNDLLYLGLGTLQGGNWQVDIFDALGKLVWTISGISHRQGQLVIPTEALAPGSYCLRVHGSKQSHTARFIKQ